MTRTDAPVTPIIQGLADDEPLNALMLRWLKRWHVLSLTDRLEVQYSRRMSRALGLCYVEQELIRLSADLRQPNNRTLLVEVACHEAAHAAVHERYGRKVRPHGQQWQQLMRLAGYRPRVQIPASLWPKAREAYEQRAAYIHQCKTCGQTVQRKTTSRRWRCSTCVEAGKVGEFIVTRRRV